MKLLPERVIFHQANGKVCRIVPGAPGTFVLFCGMEMLHTMSGPYAARWLSECALASGALEVRWDFDLKKAEE